MNQYGLCFTNISSIYIKLLCDLLLFVITGTMEQIVKIFVHQSYFIENDLVVDFNVEPEVILV